MAKFGTTDLIQIVIAGLLMGLLLPTGLTELVNIGNQMVTVNGTSVAFSTVAPAVIITLLGTVVPIVLVVNILRKFL